MSDITDEQEQLQREAAALLRDTAILQKLETLGQVTRTGSSVTGLMVYPDVDFTIQNDSSNFDDAVKLVPELVSELHIISVKLADFKTPQDPYAGYYIGFEVPFNGKNWHIDATIGHSGEIVTNPVELAGWIANMSETERKTILELKKELIIAKRYVGARSQPPYTFRSIHLYEGVLKGHATTITELEQYFKQADAS